MAEALLRLERHQREAERRMTGHPSLEHAGRLWRERQSKLSSQPLVDATRVWVDQVLADPPVVQSEAPPLSAWEEELGPRRPVFRQGNRWRRKMPTLDVVEERFKREREQAKRSAREVERLAKAERLRAERARLAAIERAIRAIARHRGKAEERVGCEFHGRPAKRSCYCCKRALWSQAEAEYIARPKTPPEEK